MTVTIPEVGPLLVAPDPVTAHATTVRVPGVPMVQVRLLGATVPADAAAIRLLPGTLRAGTGVRSGTHVAVDFQRIGASLSARVDADYLTLAGDAPGRQLAAVLQQFVAVATAP